MIGFRSPFPARDRSHRRPRRGRVGRRDLPGERPPERETGVRPALRRGHGSILHVAFVGDGAAGADASPDTRLYYAAVNGGADFANRATTRAQVLATCPRRDRHGDAYTGARHPQIALRTSSEIVILFQAIPAGEANYKLFPRRGDDRQQCRDIPDRVRGPGRGGARMPGTLTAPPSPS